MQRLSKLLMLIGLLVLPTLPITSMAGPPKFPQASPKVSPPATPRTAPTPKQQVSPSTVRALSPDLIEDLANKRFLDPKAARALYENGMAEAKREFPDLFGKFTQEHHVIPKYLGGPQSGKTVTIDRAYHQLITNAFRERYKYNQSFPSIKELRDILEHVYSRYPLPGVHF